MAYLYCRICNGDGMVSVIYCNHEQKTVRRSTRCCFRCNMHGPLEHFTETVVIVNENEIEKLLALGYQFPDDIAFKRVV